MPVTNGDLSSSNHDLIEIMSKVSDIKDVKSQIVNSFASMKEEIKTECDAIKLNLISLLPLQSDLGQMKSDLAQSSTHAIDVLKADIFALLPNISHMEEIKSEQTVLLQQLQNIAAKEDLQRATQNLLSEDVFLSKLSSSLSSSLSHLALKSDILDAIKHLPTKG
jgi:hypothetical protein